MIKKTVIQMERKGHANLGDMGKHDKRAWVHWMIPGDYPDLSSLSNSNLASIRMRAGLVAKNASTIGITLSAGDHISPESQRVVIGKIGADCQQGRAEFWLRQLTAAKQAGKRIVLDYTDHHLANQTSPMRPFYLKALPLVDEAVVSSDLMKSHLQSFFNGLIHVISDPLETPITPPDESKSGDRIKTVLWFGHATNIMYLTNYLSNQEVCDGDFNLIVLSNDIGLKAFASQHIGVKGQIQVNLLRWSIAEMCSAARLSDACIIPSDVSDPVKSGASSNRLLTALALGLPTLAENLASYVPFDRFYRNIRETKISDFLNQLPKECLKVKMAQREVLPHYTQDALLRHWASIFDRS